jgi:hypothetical protein
VKVSQAGEKPRGVTARRNNTPPLVALTQNGESFRIAATAALRG